MRKVACWGLGTHALRNLLPALKSSTRIELIGAWTRNQTVLSRVSSEYQIHPYSNEKELLDDPQIDTIILATPTGLHLQQGKQVIDAGKHLWCEKSVIVPKNSELLDRAVANRLEVNELFMFLYHPQFAELSSILSSGELGRLFSLTCRFGIPHLSTENVRYDHSLGGGSLLDAGCYPVAAAHALIGSSPQKITSFLSTESGFSVDTYGRALFEYESGVSAFLEWGFGLSYVNEIQAWCEEGHISVQRAFSKPAELKTSIRIMKSDGSIEEIEIVPNNHFLTMFNSYCNRTDHHWIANQSNLVREIVDCSAKDWGSDVEFIW